MMGVTFASVGPMLAMAGNADVGLLGIYGAVIAAGIFGVVVAPFVSRLLPLFPPVVTGTIILVIGISLMRVGINWAGGGLPMLTKVIDGQTYSFANPAYGELGGLLIALFVLLVILALTKYGKGFVGNVAVLLGIVVGSVLAALLGAMHFDKVAAAPMFDIIYPFHFGLPTFDLVAIATMCLVMIVVMIEFDRHVPGAGRHDRAADRRGRADQGPARRRRRHDHRRHLQHLPLHLVLAECRPGRGDRRALALGHGHGRRHHAAAGPAAEDGGAGGIGAGVVLGGAGLVMFGMVAATGARILGAVDFRTNRHNLFVVALSIGFGMIPLVAPNFFKQLPHELHPLLESGILLAAIAAVLLNVSSTAIASSAEARAAAAATTHGAEA